MYRLTAVVALALAIGCAGVASAEAAPSFAPFSQFGTGLQPAGVTSADFDGDGRSDLAASNMYGESVSVLLNNGSGGFGANTDFATGYGPSDVVAADFNADGKPDLAVANASSASVTVWFGDGAGGFGARQDLGTGRGPFDLQAGDFNGDGKPDLAVANTNADTITVFLSDGAGGFNSYGDFATGARPVAVVKADFNGDGKPDLATANASSNTVSVLLNTGSGGFGPPTDYPAGTGTYSITSADFNGDGKPDLATASSGANTVSVLLNTGSGEFGPQTNFASQGPLVIAVTSDDFNNDGKSDLAVSNAGTYSVSVLLGDGSGGFGTNTDFPTGDVPYGLTSDDFDGDGKRDLAVANFGGNSVSVLLNTTNVSPVAHDDAATVAQDSGATTLDVLSNDTDTEGDRIRITAVSNSAHGTTTYIPGNPERVTYTPETGYCNEPGAGPTDHFEYIVNGGARATVTVTVTCPEEPPPVVTPPPSNPPPSNGAPLARLSLTGLSANHRCTRSATLIKPKTGAKGLSFSFKLSEAATVRYSIVRRKNGPRWASCPRPTNGTKTSFGPFAKGDDAGVKGTQSTSLATGVPVKASASATARIRAVDIGRKLTPGTYILKVSATTADGRKSKVRSVRFWVLAPKR